MIENYNDFLSLLFVLMIVVGCIAGAVKLNDAFRKDEAVDEYYRDLL